MAVAKRKTGTTSLNHHGVRAAMLIAAEILQEAWASSQLQVMGAILPDDFGSVQVTRRRDKATLAKVTSPEGMGGFATTLKRLAWRHRADKQTGPLYPITELSHDDVCSLVNRTGQLLKELEVDSRFRVVGTIWPAGDGTVHLFDEEAEGDDRMPATLHLRGQIDPWEQTVRDIVTGGTQVV
ncbi:hypothetical protein KKI23_00505 [Patescibacteria group bacterium]|nr:hypothetical protein [Patescibacteria group bacterium]